MLRYLVMRIGSLLASLVVASLVIFAVVEVVPGDPATFMLGLNAAPETVAALRAELGLNGGVVQRYFSWVAGLMDRRANSRVSGVPEAVSARLSML